MWPLWLLGLGSAAEISISHLAVLLPYKTENSLEYKFPLEGFNGCFTWVAKGEGLVFDVDPASVCRVETANGVREGSRVIRLLPTKPAPTGTGTAGTGTGTAVTTVATVTTTATAGTGATGTTAPAATSTPISSAGTPAARSSGTITSSLTRDSIWIVATDLITGEKAECEVVLGLVRRLKILTTTRLINVGDKELISLQAFDNEGNVFSSISGLSLQWQIGRDGVLRRVSAGDADLHISPWHLAAHQRGFDTDLLPLRALHPGKTNITAKVKDPGHQSDDVVEVAVIEPLCLRPVRAWMCPQSVLELVLRTRPLTKHRTDHVGDNETLDEYNTYPPSFTRVIPMPSEQYSWQFTNGSVISLDEQRGLVLAKRIGYSLVRVIDKVTDNFQTTEIFVVDPVRIALRLKQKRDADCPAVHYARLLQEYDLEVLVYGPGGEKMVVSNMDFEMRVEGTSVRPLEFATESFVLSGSKLRVRADTMGTTFFYAKLNRVKNYPLQTLEASLAVEVTEAVRIQPGSLVLPFVEDPRITHSYQLQVSGGSGRYTWVGSDVASVTDGLVLARALGSALVNVSDSCAAENMHNITVTVSQPQRLAFLPTLREAQVGSEVVLAVVVTDEKNNLFSNCSQISLDPSIQRGFNTFSLSTAPEELSCGGCPWFGRNESCFTFAAKAQALGFAQIAASLAHLKDQDAPMATAWVSGYFPLSVKNSPIILGQGFSQELSWSSGPLPWPEQSFDDIDPTTFEGPDARTYRPGTTLTAALTALRAGSWDSQEREGLYHTMATAHPSSADEFNWASLSASVAATEPTDNIYSIRVTCLDIAYAQPLALRLRVGNEVSPSNPVPLVEELYVKLMCYPKLATDPRLVRVSPLGSKHVYLVNGPKTPEEYYQEDTAVEHTHPLWATAYWKIDNESVAIVRKDGLLDARNIGNTTLRVEVPHPRDGSGLLGVGLDANVTVRVEFGGFVIRAPTHHLLPATRTLLYVAGVDGEAPDNRVFESVRCTWRTTDPALELRPPLAFPIRGDAEARHKESRNDGVAPANPFEVAGSSVVVVPARAGRFKVSAFIEVVDPVVPAERASFMQWLELVVIEPLVLLVPPLLVLPFGARVPLATSFDPSKLDYIVFSPDPKNPLVTVSSTGILQAAAFQNTFDSAEVGILISTREDAALSASSFSSPSQPPRGPLAGQTSQSLSVRVSLRLPQQLVLDANITGPLCVSQRVVVGVHVADRLGRMFDSLEATDLTDAALNVESSNPSVVRIGKRVLEKGMRAVEAYEGRGGAQAGLLSLVTIEALSAPLGSAQAVLRFSLGPAFPDVEPLFIDVQVAKGPQCEEPGVGRVTWTLTSSAALNALHRLSDSANVMPRHEVERQRREFERVFVVNISRALDIPSASVVLSLVNPVMGFLEFEIYPQHSLSPFHPSQWQQAYMHRGRTQDGGLVGQTSTTDMCNVHSNFERVSPQELVKKLRAQLADPSSVLRSSVLIHHLLPLGSENQAPKLSVRKYRAWEERAQLGCTLLQNRTVWSDTQQDTSTNTNVPRPLLPRPDEPTETVNRRSARQRVFASLLTLLVMVLIAILAKAILNP